MAPQAPHDTELDAQITRDLIRRTDRMFEEADTLQRRARKQLRDHFLGKDDHPASPDVQPPEK